MTAWTLIKQAQIGDLTSLELKSVKLLRRINQAADLYCLLRTRLTHHQRKIADANFNNDADVRDAALQRGNLEKLKH